ncbi:hypothetical protein GALMADRAFT_145954, partial [Galerina marginata CBS 339.88]
MASEDRITALETALNALRSEGEHTQTLLRQFVSRLGCSDPPATVTTPVTPSFPPPRDSEFPDVSAFPSAGPVPHGSDSAPLPPLGISEDSEPSELRKSALLAPNSRNLDFSKFRSASQPDAECPGPRFPVPKFRNVAPLRPGVPPDFDGDRSLGRSFLFTCRTYIRLVPTAFPDVTVQILWVLSFMKSGRAFRWAERKLALELTEGFPWNDWAEFERDFR